MAQSTTRRRTRTGTQNRNRATTDTVTVEMSRPLYDAFEGAGRAFARLVEVAVSPATTLIASASRIRETIGGGTTQPAAATPRRRQPKSAPAARPRLASASRGDNQTLDERILAAMPSTGSIRLDQLRAILAKDGASPQSITLRLTALARGSRRRPARLRREGDYVTRSEEGRRAA